MPHKLPHERDIEHIKRHVRFNMFENRGKMQLDVVYDISKDKEIKILNEEIHRLRKENNDLITLAFY